MVSLGTYVQLVTTVRLEVLLSKIAYLELTAMSLVLKHVLNVQNVSTVRVLKEIARNQFLVLKATTVPLGLENHSQNAPPEHTILS